MKATNQKIQFIEIFLNRILTHSKISLGQFVRSKSAFKVVFTKKLQIKGPK
jgi:hypothetical protein